MVYVDGLTLPFLALSCPTAISAFQLLSGLNRTRDGQPNSVENDPKRKSATPTAEGLRARRISSRDAVAASSAVVLAQEALPVMAG